MGLLLTTITQVGCFDVFTSSQHHLIGSLSVINSHNQQDKGYFLVSALDGFNKNVITDYVERVDGNDTLLLVKAVDRSTCDELYFYVKHREGVTVLETIAISEADYSRYRYKKHYTVQFEDGDFHCP